MIFIDTTVWAGAINRNDELYSSSKAIIESILKGKLPLALTTDYVLDETLTILGEESCMKKQPKLFSQF